MASELPRELIDAMDGGLALLDNNTRVIAWNAWLAAASGIPTETAIGRKLEELFSSHSLEPILSAISDSLESGTSSLLTHALHPRLLPLSTGAGRALIHDVTVSSVRSVAGIACLVQIRDVTVSAERERILRERLDARYDAVVASASDVILTVDADDIVHLANSAIFQQFGYSPKEVIQGPAGILFEDRQSWDRARNAVLNCAATSPSIEIKGRRKDGSLCHFEVSLSRWTSNSRMFVAAILRNVSERHAAEEALRASENQFRSLAQAMPNHVWTSPPSGILDWFNDTVYEYSGARPGMLDDGAWLDLVHPNDRAATKEAWSAAVATGRPHDAQFRLRRADGVYRWYLARAVPLKNAEGEVLRWVGTHTDIEDQKVAAQALVDLNVLLEARVAERTRQLMEAEEALRQSQKMEAVGQLTGGIAHDFNNLLQGIIGALDRVQRLVAAGRISETDKFVRGATESANRAAALTQRLLTFSRRQPIDPRPLDMNRLIETMEELLRRSMGEATRLVVKGDKNLWHVRCDANQLENALLNLAINARDAMPDGGTATIATSNVVLDEESARRKEVTAGEYVKLTVEDTGVGMPPDVKQRAFDPFFTTKPIGQGTGLGLSMIYGFARQSDGAVQIESEPGEGTTIEFYLPRFKGELVEETESETPVADVRTDSGEVVLVVEDEAIIRMLVVEVLNDLGYRALEASEGSSALRILQSSQRIDLLVTDIGLPGLNGRQLADAARIKRPGLKVLFMTGYAENAAGGAFLEDGMEIIAKPFVMASLATKIREMVESSPRQLAHVLAVSELTL